MSAVLEHLEGRTIRLTNLDRVMYPQLGTTKGQIIDYYEAVGASLVEQAKGRPVTRIRFPHGVGEPSFFEKNAPFDLPDWIPTKTISAIRYPELDEVAAVVWMAQSNAIELHTPQWHGDGLLDRLVIDLDPGPGSGLPQCCAVALLVADYLRADGMKPAAVTSGRNGLQVYATFDEPIEPWAVVNYSRVMAVDLAEARPDLIGATLSPSPHERRVFIDWTRNHPAKTTVTPYSLRGGDLPYAATPVTWDEVREGLTEQFLFTETMSRLRRLGDLLAA